MNDGLSSSVSEPGPALRPSDADVLAMCAEGDEEAARELVRRYQADVLRFVSRMLGPSDPGLDDLVQLTFLAALQAAGTYGGRSSARTWLIGIAHNKVRMEIRSRTRRRRAMAFLARLRLVEPAARPAEGERAVVARRIQEAILTLEANRRAVFVLCEVEGRTAAEVASSMGVPPGTVRRWRADARRALQPKLADLWHSGEGT